MLTWYACAGSIAEHITDGVPELCGNSLDAIVSVWPWASSRDILDQCERAFVLAKLGGGTADMEALVKDAGHRAALFADDGLVAKRLRGSVMVGNETRVEPGGVVVGIPKR